MTKFSPLINAHNAISASGLACTFFVVPLEQASFRSALRQGRKCLQQIVLAGAIANLRRELRCTTRLDPSSALFGSLREKRLELRHNLGAVAVRALNALLFVLTDRHRKGETLATLLAKIFVKRHINPCYYWLASPAKYYSASITIFHLNAHSFWTAHKHFSMLDITTKRLVLPVGTGTFPGRRVRDFSHVSFGQPQLNGSHRIGELMDAVGPDDRCAHQRFRHLPG
jgi:hypothetical protein